MIRRTLSSLLVGALLLPAAASAKFCGDNVNGEDVACDCGDVVVSDLVLGSDPVTRKTCDGDGLIVRATGAPSGITIDLHGSTLQGSNTATGILILYGGPGGARLISSTGPATIQGFGDGVFAHGPDAVALIDGIVAVQSKQDGIRVDGKAYEIRNSEARGSGRDGFSLNGSGFQLAATRARDNKRDGYFVMGSHGVVGAPGAGAVAEGSGMHGFSVNGMAHQLQDCVARLGGKNGVQLNGMYLEIRGCSVADNGGDGIYGMGSNLQLAGNVATNNQKNGILVDGPQLADLGGNRGIGNRGLRLQTPVAQCKIARQPCLQ